MSRRKRIMVAPIVDDVAVLQSLVARLAHYLSHVGVERITVPVSASLASYDPPRLLSDPRVPVGFDPEVAGRVRSIASKFEFITVDVTRALPTTVSDFLLVWDVPAMTHEPWSALAAEYQAGVTRFDVDWRNTRNDGGQFAAAAHTLLSASRRFDPAEIARFKLRTAHLADAPVATLIATGPSARDVLAVDLDEGVRIVCNTAILDRSLMDHVRPHIVTFADPIFHFGPSTYAHQYHRGWPSSPIAMTSRW